MANEKIQNEYYQFLNAIGKNIVFKIVKILGEHDKVATGTLINSIDYIIEGKKGQQFISLLAEDYLYWVDQGRLPGKGMPVNNLLEWMRVRGIPEEASYAINQSIKQNGIPGLHFLESVINSIEAEFESRASRFPEVYEEELYNQLKRQLNIEVQ